MTQRELRHVLARCALNIAERAEVIAVVAVVTRENADLRGRLTELRPREGTNAQYGQRVLTVLGEFGMEVPTQRQAALLLSREIAEAILSNDLSWLEGAEAIWRVAVSSRERVPELDTFQFAALEAEANPHMHRAYRDGVVRASRDLVQMCIE